MQAWFNQDNKKIIKKNLQIDPQQSQENFSESLKIEPINFRTRLHTSLAKYRQKVDLATDVKSEDSPNKTNEIVTGETEIRA